MCALLNSCTSAQETVNRLDGEQGLQQSRGGSFSSLDGLYASADAQDHMPGSRDKQGNTGVLPEGSAAAKGLAAKPDGTRGAG